MDLAQSLKDAEKQYEIGGGDYFKFEKGENKIRVLTTWDPLATHFVKIGGKDIAHVCFGKEEGCPYHGEGAPLDEKGNPKKPSVKFVTYICDRKDGDQIKLADLPYTVVKAIVALQKDEEYNFDDLPMPYDLKITYDPDQSGSAMYNVLPSSKRDPLPDFVIDGMINKKHVTKIVDEKKAKEAFGK
jgi:hypothetical protein